MTIRNFHVPEHAPFGGEAVLTCDFDLEGEPLYSVKWYKDVYEFARFKYDMNEGGQVGRVRVSTFDVAGVSVDVSEH